ncbi:leucine--tRNA ligase [Ilumatobacter nonamiensis]|uniref:leucine--tRNA ligase n=1 Tax=Ilumatobacter nonamiensis TaxID=467093 RepID=UPI0003488EDD|nr:leucine--tRNA ligase [Ilumatobacter nonamiensis]
MSDENSTTSSPTADTPAYRYTSELAQEIEVGWQDRWDAAGVFETPNPVGPLGDAELVAERGEKLFVQDMFPYPSGVGLHVGHPLGYIGTDVFSRYKRMTGHNVLYTMGFDAFGLPAEQYAVQTGTHPAVTTDANIATMRRQLRRLGLSHDTRRSISTIDPDYYRWTQWIFSQIFNAWYDTDAEKARPIDELIAEFDSGARTTHDGHDWADLSPSERDEVIDDHRLAYVSEAPVNWCPGLGTVVANEEVTADGRSDRGNFPVFKRNMRQWMMRITAYADRLIDDLDTLDWTDAIKSMQRNWIGRSHGAKVHFASAAGPITVFTTRPDTLFGASFMVLSPEHPYVDELADESKRDEIAAYREQAVGKKDFELQDDTREKTGVFTGAYATNPINGEQLPIWIADYVLMGYGTGAIMAVPCGDERDFEFARKFGLPIPAIQQPPAEWFADHGIEPGLDTTNWPTAYVGDAAYVQSAGTPAGTEPLDLNGIDNTAEGIAMTNAWLEAHDAGEATINYKLRDWLFSRQRYWGEPFPIVYDEDGRPHTVPDELLPIELPETDQFSPRTFDADDEFSNPESPLDRLEDWVNVELDLGDGRGVRSYRRDTNVMPQWAGSCWYQFRYIDPTLEERFVDPENERYWMGPRTDIRPDHPGGIDLYVGGVEHAVLHLLYARFWHKVLYDLGHVSSIEPYARLYNQGYIQAAAFKDEREIYVEASEVVEEAEIDGEPQFSFHEQPVTREWGKMGKSLKNAVSPDEMYEQYGADTLRLYEMAMGPLDASRPWSTRDVVGQYRFLQRLWRNMVDETTGDCTVVDEPADDETRRLLHKTIDVVRTEMEALRFNTAIAKLIELNNHVTKLDAMPREVAEPMVLMLAPLVPHVAEELWAKLGRSVDTDGSITYVEFPVADPDLLVDDTIEVPIQVNGKVRSRMTVAADASEDDLEAGALADEKIVAALDGGTPKKVIVVPGRMVNVVV